MLDWLTRKEGSRLMMPMKPLALELLPFGDCSNGKLLVFEKSKT